jgi:hypothetical protein
MPDPCAQRTLVKSPPELWAEISDAAALARHLGEFGEIRITRLEAETTVVWEGDRARGTVELEPSGWGTKVTITAQPAEVAEPPAAVEEEPAVVEEPAPEPPAAIAEEPAVAEEPAIAEEPVIAEEPAAVAEPAFEPLSVAPPTPAATTVDPLPERRPGFFARLFGRRRKAAAQPPAPVVEEPAPVVEEPAAVVEEPAPASPPAVAVADPDPVVEEPPVVESPPVVEEPVAEAASPEPPEHLGPERIEAVLVGVLDDLGSAHHRPFSRG